MANYVVADPAGKSKYEPLIKDMWNWMYTRNCDQNPKQGDITFLRDESLGNNRIVHAGFTMQRPSNAYRQTFRIDVGEGCFAAVYHVNIVKSDPFHLGGGPCKTISNCFKTAQNDMGNLYDKWANITEPGNSASHAIVDNLDDYYFEVGPFTVKVPDNNNALQTEQGLALKKGDHEGVVVGYFLLIEDFKPGKYEIDMGGNATNWYTHSIYRLNVR